MKILIVEDEERIVTLVKQGLEETGHVAMIAYDGLKIRIAREEQLSLASSLNSGNTNGTDDTVSSGKTLEDGSATLEKESINQLAASQKKFIEQLEAALRRIENKTYGICCETGKLISMERLRAVPHTTLSMEAKSRQT